MFSIAGIDLLEQELLDHERTLLEILLQDKTTSDGAMVDNLMKELEDAQKLEGSADEKKIRTALKAIGINYDKLTEDERKLIKKILYKTAMLKPGTLAGNRGKHRR